MCLHNCLYFVMPGYHLVTTENNFLLFFYTFVVLANYHESL